MTEEVKTETTETVEETAAPEISNAEAKQLPWVQKMAQELNTLRQEKEAQAAAQKAAQKEAEEQRLKDAGMFDELKSRYEAELEQTKMQHAKDVLERDLKTELIKTGFVNDMFARGAIAGYDAETHGDVASYVAALAADESNKTFLAGNEGRKVHTPPTATPGGMASSALRGDKLIEYANSDDPKQREQAIASKKAWYDKHGSFDGLYKN
jgi:hypothetical protein